MLLSGSFVVLGLCSVWIDERVVQNCQESVHSWIWIPETVCVVLGNANQAHVECHLDACQRDKIPVLKRAGGGGAVVLHPGCLIISLGVWVNHYYRNQEFFHSINSAVIECLQKHSSDSQIFSQNGLSDITLNGRKVAGTSLFRSRNFLLYQASLLVDLNLPLIERYLAHPSREPEYRQGKSHRDFLTSWSEHVSHVGISQLQLSMESHFSQKIKVLLKDEIRDPDPAQVDYLLHRFSSDSSKSSVFL